MTSSGGSGLFAGFDAVGEGARLLRRPAVRPYVLIPVAINILVLIVGGWALYRTLADSVGGALPPDYAWLRYLVLPLLFIALAMGGFLLFSLLANLLATPFNGLLCEAILRELEPGTAPPPVRGLWDEVRLGLRGEWAKGRYLLKLLIPAILLWLVPGANALSVIVWPLVGIWVLTLEYLDGVLGNQGQPFPAALHWMRTQRGLCLGAGIPLFLLTAVPGVNVVAMPLGVATASVLYSRHLRPALPRHG